MCSSDLQGAPVRQAMPGRAGGHDHHPPVWPECPPAPDPAGDRGPVRHLPLLCIAPRLLQARRGMSPGAGTARTETPPSLRCQSGKSQLLGGRPGVPDVRPTSTPVVQSAQRIPEVSGHQVNEYAVGGTAGQVPSGQGIQKAVVLKFPAVPDYGADSALYRD